MKTISDTSAYGQAGRRLWTWALLFSLMACQPATPTKIPAPPSSGSAVTPSAVPHLDLRFPSLNGSVDLPASLSSTTLRADFVGGGSTLAGELTRTEAGLTLHKPLDAPPTGQVVFSDGTRTIGQTAYATTSTMIDVAVNVPAGAFPFRVDPVESSAAAGARTIRVQPGTKLRLLTQEGNTVLGEVTVDDAGNISSVDGRISGARASLQLNLQPIQLDMQGVQAPVRVGPFETDFRAGNRLLWLPSGTPVFLAIGTNSVRIENIVVGRDGTVSQGQGLIKAQKDTLVPLTRTISWEAGAYVGGWRLRHYEPTFAVGSRSIPVVASDRQLIVNFGDVTNETAPFDPDAPTGPLKMAGNALTFNLVPIIVDPDNLNVPIRVQPFETTVSTGKRTVQMPRMAATGNVALVSGSETTGAFRLDADGTLSSNSPGLFVSGSTLRLSTVSVRVDTDGSLRAYRVMPFEIPETAGSRTITMVRGQAARIESQGAEYRFQIDGDGTITSRDPHLSPGSSSLRITWTP